MELLGFPGLAKEEEVAILEFLQNCLVLFVDEAIEQEAIRLRRTNQCKLPDTIVVATAQVHQLILLTLDQRLKNLSVQI
jgi:hypothetical protein